MSTLNKLRSEPNKRLENVRYAFINMLIQLLCKLKLEEGANAPGHHFLRVTKDLELLCLSREFLSVTL